MEKKYTGEDLKIMQSWDLQKKIQVTQTKIMEWYNYYDGKVYVSFSGGKDSTVLLDLCRRVYPDIEAVFVDTGLEYPEIRDFVKSIENVTWIKPEMNFREVISKYGYPVISKEASQAISGARKGWKSMQAKLDGTSKDKNGNKSSFNQQKYKYLLDSPFLISHECCGEMKKKPFKKFNKLTGKMPIIGTMASESSLRKSAWLRQGCNAFDGVSPKSQPLSFWTEQDILQYINLVNLPYCSIYGDIIPDVEWNENTKNNTKKLKLTGLTRTGCMFCMFGVHLEKEPNRFQRMKETHPKMWDYCIREENGLGIGKVLDFIDVKYE